jgi:hypothetical protein
MHQNIPLEGLTDSELLLRIEALIDSTEACIRRSAARLDEITRKAEAERRVEQVRDTLLYENEATDLILERIQQRWNATWEAERHG